MFSKEIFSVRLRELRTERKIKQSVIAEMLDVTDGAISSMETAIRGPSIEVAYALADYFGVSIDYLVGRTDNPEVSK